MFSSFSKYFSMTGWRIGWMLVPERLRRPVDVLTGNFTICPPAIAQWAAVLALSPQPPEGSAMPTRYAVAQRATVPPFHVMDPRVSPAAASRAGTA